MANKKFTVLLTLGRLPKALELARCLHGAGCRVVVADPARWHLCRPSRAVAACYPVTEPTIDLEAYLDQLLAIVARENVGLVIPVSEESLHVSALHDRLPKKVYLMCAPFKELGQLHHKLLFAHQAKNLGLATPPTFGENSTGARELMIGGEYVAKPAHSSSGLGVQVCRLGRRHEVGQPGMVVQKYIEGDHVSSLTLMYRGREVTTVLYRGKVYNGTVATSFERVDHAPSVHIWISQFCKQTNYSGFLGFDFIVDAQEKAWAIECNPRPTSGIHFLDPEDLGAAILRPSSIQEVRRKPAICMQWLYGTLAELVAAVLQPRTFKRYLRQIFKSRDVVWSIKDPLPFLLYVPMTWEFIWPALRTEQTLAELLLEDIAWSPNAGAETKPAAPCSAMPNPSGLSRPASAQS